MIEVGKKTKKFWKMKPKKTPGPRAGCGGDGEWRSMSRKPKAVKQKKNKAAESEE